MKTEFTKEYILENKGCYSKKEVESIKCFNNKKITIKQLFKDLPIKDFSWFLVRKCELSVLQQQLLALHCVKQVLPIYEEKHPNDKRVSECVEYAEKYLNGETDIDTLRTKRADAVDAADAARAATPYALARAAAYTVDAVSYVTAAAAAVSYAVALADASVAYENSIWTFVETIISKKI